MHIHEVVITKVGYDIVSADTRFYAFIGQRAWISFEHLVCEEDQTAFLQYLNARIGERFVIRLLDEKNDRQAFLVWFSERTDPREVRVNLINTDEIIQMESEYKRRLRIKNALLEVYDHIYFEYTPKNGMVRLYSVEKTEQILVQTDMDELEHRVRENAPQQEKASILSFLSELRAGKRHFSLITSYDVFQINLEGICPLLQFDGSSIYEDGEFVCAVGVGRAAGPAEAANVPNELRRDEDSLTGVLSKAEITGRAIEMIDVKKIKNISIAIVDVDNFKSVNDTYGHLKGDEILKRVAAFMEKEVGDSGLVGRIGGDEFFIVFYNAPDMEETRGRLKSLKNGVRTAFPEGDPDNPAVTLSIGCAAYPKDADNYEDLFKLADYVLYLAKEKGKDRYIIYDEAKHGSLQEIRQSKTSSRRIDSRGNMSKGDILCELLKKVFGNDSYSFQQFLDDFVVNYGVQRIMVYSGNPLQVVYMAGERQLSKQRCDRTGSYLKNTQYRKYFDSNGVLIVGNIDYFAERIPGIYELLKAQGVISYVQICCKDRDDEEVIVSFEAVKKKMVWNKKDVSFYPILKKIMREYSMKEDAMA